MRELKFKAKRIDNGEWVVFTINQILGDNGKHLIVALPIKCSVMVDNTTICQFTGITDSQGNDIYEGDEVIDEGLRTIVVFKEGIQQTCLVYPEGDEFRVGRHIIERITLTGKNIKD